MPAPSPRRYKKKRPTNEMLLAGRYRPLQALKQRAGERTYLGSDIKSGAQVAIKTLALSGLTGDARQRLAHEAEVLRHLELPRYRLLAHGEDQEWLFLVATFVEGRTLEERLRHGPLALEETLALGRCLFEALAVAHAQGVLHRDVKPANIVVDERGPIDQATLIDFGLACSDRLHFSIRDIPVGTARYIAPEQAGLLKAAVDGRADLYAAGIVLFESLTGRPPFLGKEVGDVLRQQVAAAAPEVRSLGVTVPVALEQIIARLLRKAPAERYQAVEAVLEELAAVHQALRHGEREPALVVGSHDRRSTLAEPVFVGRKAALHGLDLALQQTLRGDGGLVLIRGAAGIGKTRLMGEWARYAALQGAWLVRGQADRAPRRPFGLLEGIADEVVARASANAGLAQAIRERLAEHRAPLCLALPRLAQVLGTPAAVPLGLDEHGSMRATGALATLLELLGQLDQPVVLLLDDCQWADEQSLASIESWRRLERSGGLLVVAGVRGGGPAPAQLDEPDRVIDLAPLEARQVHQLIESMAGRMPDEAIELVTGLAEGSPFMAVATLWGLVEGGVLVGESSSWRLVPDALERVSSSRRAAAMLATRLEQLQPSTRELLQLAAVLGDTFELEDLRALSEAKAEAISSALDQALERRLLWQSAGRRRFRFVHQRLRDALLEGIATAKRRGLHQRAAEQLVRRNDEERQLETAYHFDAAGSAERAVPYALAAARDASRRYALDVAEQQLIIAERGLAAHDRQTQLEVLETLADVLALRDKHASADARLTRAISLCEGELDRARVLGKQAQVAFRRGDSRAAAEGAIAALRLCQRRIPTGRAGLARGLGREVVTRIRHLTRSWLGAHHAPAAPMAPGADAGRERLELATRLHAQLAHVWWWERGVLPALWTHLGQLNLAEGLPASAELGQAYAKHALVLSAIPLHGPAKHYIERSHQICREIGEPRGIGHALCVHGLLLNTAGRPAKAMAKLEEAIPFLERAGDGWELLTALVSQAYASYLLGDLDRAAELARQVFDRSCDQQQPFFVAAALDIWARASGGRVPRALLEGALEARRAGPLLQAKGICLLRDGEHDAAADAFEQGWRLIRPFRLEPCLGLPGWIATAKRLSVERRADRAALRSARRTARLAERLGRRFPNHLPHALRERGLLAALGGQLPQARRYLDESLAAARRHDMRYEQAQTQLARAELGRRLGWPGLDAEEAHRALGLLGVHFANGEAISTSSGDGNGAPAALSFSLADRYERVLEEGHSIATALSPGAVFSAVRQAALTLLRGDECLVLRVEGDDYRLVAGEDRSVFSRSLAERALATGAAEIGVCGAAAEGDPSESLLLGGVQSALVAPILQRQQTAYCLFVAHRQLSGLFGPDELRIASFITSLAAAALENAHNYRQLAGRVILAHERERVDIARELHDGIGQLLAVIKMEGDWLENHAEDPQEVRRVADNICDKVDETLAVVRDLSHALRPRVLDDLGIGCALETLVSGMARHSTIAFDAKIEDVERVPGDVATAVYRIAQEALANMLRHGDAERCRVCFTHRPPSVLLEVEHDGRVVVETELDNSRSMGVAGMRERASLLGGELMLAPRMGGGTQLLARIPCTMQRGHDESLQVDRGA